VPFWRFSKNRRNAEYCAGSLAAPDENGGRFRVNANVVASEHEMGVTLMHVQTGKFHLCHGAAATTWHAIANGRSLSAVVEELSSKHSLPVDQARIEVGRLIADFTRRKLIVPDQPQSKSATSFRLLAAALWELFAYDFLMGVFGFRSVHQALAKRPLVTTPATPSQHDLAIRVIRSVSVAITFYWHPVLCLQRSIVAARLLRALRIPAEVVIGYRPAPFFSHAWVEVSGRVINDSPALPWRLTILHRI
jgi:Transglutaminase-like superfamily